MSLILCTWQKIMWRTRFSSVFGGCGGCGTEFSEVVSRTKASCDPEQLRVGHRGLSTEKQQCLKVSGTQQILGNPEPRQQLSHPPKLAFLGEWREMAFFRGSSGLGWSWGLDLYFRPSLGIAPNCHCSLDWGRGGGEIKNCLSFVRWEREKEKEQQQTNVRYFPIFLSLKGLPFLS